MTKGAKRNSIRYLYGETNTIELPVREVKTNECDEIVRGDIIYLNNRSAAGNRRHIAFPAGRLADASVGDTRKWFVGIAQTDSKDGDTADIQVATTGVFKIPLNTATTVKPGYIAKLVTSGGGGGASVEVDQVSAAADDGTFQNAIGKVVEKGTSVTSAIVQIFTPGFGGSVEYVPAS